MQEATLIERSTTHHGDAQTSGGNQERYMLVMAWLVGQDMRFRHRKIERQLDKPEVVVVAGKLAGDRDSIF